MPCPTAGNGAYSHKIDYITICKKILNLEGHQNHSTGSRVMAILLEKSDFFPIGQSGEASWWRDGYHRGLPHIVSQRIIDSMN